MNELIIIVSCGIAALIILIIVAIGVIDEIIANDKSKHIEDSNIKAEVVNIHKFMKDGLKR